MTEQNSGAPRPKSFECFLRLHFLCGGEPWRDVCRCKCHGRARQIDSSEAS